MQAIVIILVIITDSIKKIFKQHFLSYVNNFTDYFAALLCFMSYSSSFPWKKKHYVRKLETTVAPRAFLKRKN